MAKSILIVDEDAGVLAFLTLLFEERGVRVLRARTRAEMLELLERNYIAVDLVLANTLIGHMSCCDLERDVAKRRESLPVVRMSAFVESGVIRVGACGRTDQTGFVDSVLAVLGGKRERARAAHA